MQTPALAAEPALEDSLADQTVIAATFSAADPVRIRRSLTLRRGRTESETDVEADSNAWVRMPGGDRVR